MKSRQMMALFLGVAATASAAADLSATEQAFLTGTSPGGHAERPTAILVMAVGRSGSSMVGEFFNQNKDVLYFYEPCRNQDHHIEGLECLALVKRLTQCSFNLDDIRWLSADMDALNRGSPELKYISNSAGAKQFAWAHEQLIDTCKQRRAVAVKSIRLYHGLGGQDYDISGLRVLHLVRDPRGVVRSQQEHFEITQWGGREEDSSTARARACGTSICGTYKSQLETSKKLEDGRYLLVHYEDIATSPELAVELIYCWAGLGVVPTNVSTWIHINTNMESCNDGVHRKRHLRSKTEGSSFGYAYTMPQDSSPGYDELGDSIPADQNSFGHAEPGMTKEGGVVTKIQRRSLVSVNGQVSGSSNSEETLAECLENTKEAKHDPYGTRRQSADMVSMWRTLMPEESAQVVWDVCQDSEVMDALGYYL